VAASPLLSQYSGYGGLLFLMFLVFLCVFFVVWFGVGFLWGLAGYRFSPSFFSSLGSYLTATFLIPSGPGGVLHGPIFSFPGSHGWGQ